MDTPAVESRKLLHLIGCRGFCAFAPADRRWRRRSGSASGSGDVRAEAAARAARRGRLETVQKVCTRARWQAARWQAGWARQARNRPEAAGQAAYQAGLQAGYGEIIAWFYEVPPKTARAAARI